LKDQTRRTTAAGTGTAAVAERPRTTQGPKLYPAHGEAKPRAIVVSCIDPRFQEATDMFLEEELGLGHGTYVPFAVGGGVVGLANPFQRPKDAKFVRETIEFYVDHFSTIDRIILVNHEDCRKYAEVSRVMPLIMRGVQNLMERQKIDLQNVGAIIQKFLSRPLTIERYYARFANSERTQITFEKQ
jgi:hypothetical protein